MNKLVAVSVFLGVFVAGLVVSVAAKHGLFRDLLLWTRPRLAIQAEAASAERDLPATLASSVEGMCETNAAGAVLNCDIYNGLPNWVVTEITLEVMCWAPHQDVNKRLYRESVFIEPLKTGHVSIRLGMYLPPDGVQSGRSIKNWAFLIDGARGLPRQRLLPFLGLTWR